jgi:hypothetical protein
MNDDLIGLSGMDPALPPLGAQRQWATHDPDAPLKQTLIAGSTVVPIRKRLRKGWSIAVGKTKDGESYVIVKPTVHPYFLFEEYPGKLRLLAFHGHDLEPQEILQELTRTGNRRDVLVALKSLAKNDSPVQMIEVDLIDLANKVAEGKISP